MTYGPNNNAVLEVIDFIRNGEILRPRKGSSPPGDYQIIHTLDGVDQYRQPSIEWYTNAAEEDPVLWADIKRQCAVKYYSDAPKLFGAEYYDFEERMEALCRSLWPLLEHQLHGTLPQFEIEDVYGQFSMILRFRAVYGNAPNFYNRLFQIYKSGGHPCGWVGKYPDGKMVVYYAGSSTST
jgi:hypothetical protein